MAREQRRVHPVHGTARSRDERVADELRPADDEDHLGVEGANGRDHLGCVDVGFLDQICAKPGCDVVERALAGAIRVDRSRQRDDADNLCTGRRGRLEAVEADDVEADPDRPQGGANTSRALCAQRLPSSPARRAAQPRGGRDRFNGRVATGFVGIYSFELLFPESHSLKEKRMHLRSVKAQLTNRVACSISEVDHHDVWQRSRLTLACVAREAGEADRLIDTAERWLSGQDFELLAHERELVSLDD